MCLGQQSEAKHWHEASWAGHAMKSPSGGSYRQWQQAGGEQLVPREWIAMMGSTYPACASCTISTPISLHMD